MPTDALWFWPLMQGLAGLVVFVALLAAARRRWTGGGSGHGPGDVGLD